MPCMKKVLIITYYWPPSGGIGVLRCLKFVKYLRDFGWEPIVVAPSNPDYPYIDKGNFKDIPAGIEVLYTPIWEPFRLFKLITGRKGTSLNNIVHVRDKHSVFDKLGIWIRGNFFIPDARSMWIKPTVRFLNQYLKTNKVDAILSDGPPHTNTVIATKIAKKHGIPFLADFQDPWTQVDYYKLFKIGYFADKKHKRLEQECFKTASKITIASPSWKKDIESIGAKNVDVLYYGYDEDDFKNIVPKPDKKFTICHAGLLGFDRNPENLWIALRQLIDKSNEFKENFSLKFLGQLDVQVLNSMQKYNLQEFIDNRGLVNRDISLKEISNSWVLLLPLNKASNVNGRIPGKLYEYIRAGRPIISFGPSGTDVNNIIHQYSLGENFTWDDIAGLEKHIWNQFLKFTRNDFNSKTDYGSTSTFSNRNQTKILAGFLDDMSKNR